MIISSAPNPNNCPPRLILSLKGLGRSFGEREALRDVNLEIHEGDRIALLGPNGAGKTTLLKIIAGTLAPDTGRISLNGLTPSQARAIPGFLGWLPERAPLNPDLTVREHLTLTVAFLGLAKKEATERIEFLTQALHLEEKLGRLAGQLSLGSRRQAALAIALLVPPQLLLLDEPTSSLDPEETHRLRETLASFPQTVAFLISSHVLEEVAKVTNEALILKDGSLVSQKPWSDFPMDPEEGYLKEVSSHAAL
ncbi:MAG: ABC transporter ATP-binding protein [Deltaproteobacteria bacterium]|nr:ABC transporter ATP-binding protein [Deltaproteobacteria bacterium]